MTGGVPCKTTDELTFSENEAVSILKDEESQDADTSTGSQEAIDQASAWLKDCCANHDCSAPRQPEQASWAPTRLIDVGDGVEKTADRRPRLVFSSSLQHQAGSTSTPISWLTLSYCWGKTNHCRLLQSNIAQFLTELPLGELPQTLYDALETTHRLGYRYIWIDSLCIIQDDEDDWFRESATMQMVYSQAECTLSNAHATDAATGLFLGRPPGLLKPSVVSLRRFEGPIADEAGDGLEQQRKQRDPYVLKHYRMDANYDFETYWELDIVRGPLFQRAWVTQERLLSPRTIYFGKAQLYWSCGQSVACEAYPHGQTLSQLAGPAAGLFEGARIKFLRLLQHLERYGSYVTDLRQLQQNTWDFTALAPTLAWDEIVEKYSSSLLTVAADRAVAFAGVPAALAAASARGTGKPLRHSYGVYLNDDLPGHLLWDTDKFDPIAKPGHDLAPTWSWLSPNHPVRLPMMRSSADKPAIKAIRFVDYDGVGMAASMSKLLGYKPGLLLRGTLKLSRFMQVKSKSQGRYLADELRLPHRRAPECVIEDVQSAFASTSALEQALDALQDGPVDVLLDQHDDPPEDDAWACSGVWHRDYIGTAAGAVSICLPIWSRGLEDPVIEGLVLELVHDSSSPGVSAGQQLPLVFRRIGQFPKSPLNWCATTREVEIVLI